MSLHAGKIKGNNNTNRVEQPALQPGSYPARLVQILDLGVQPQRPYKGQEKPPAHEIMLTYEFVDEFMIDEKGEELEDKPRWYSETVRLMPLTADLATSTKRYFTFDPENKYGGDFTKVIGCPVTVTVVNNVSGDKTYVNIAGTAVMRPRDAAKCPELVNEPKIFNLGEPDLEVFYSLPQWIQDKIASNLNFRGSEMEALMGGEPEKVEVKEEEKAPAKKLKAKEKEVEPSYGPDDGDAPW